MPGPRGIVGGPQLYMCKVKELKRLPTESDDGGMVTSRNHGHNKLTATLKQTILTTGGGHVNI